MKEKLMEQLRWNFTENDANRISDIILNLGMVDRSVYHLGKSLVKVFEPEDVKRDREFQEKYPDHSSNQG